MSGITGSGCTTPSKTSATGSSAPTRCRMSGGTPATVIITIDIEDLLTGTGYGITSDGTLIRTDQVRSMTDQAEVYYAFLDRNGVVLNLGRTRRIATRGQSAALIARDARLLLSRLRPSPRMVRTTPHHSLDRRRTHRPQQSDFALRLSPPQLHSRGWTCRINPDGIPEWRPPRSVDPDQKPLINTRITALHAARIHRRQ